MSLFAPTRHYVATLVNPSTQYDATTATSHRTLIALRLLGGAAGVPLHLTARSAPSAIEGTALASLVAAILLTGFLSRAGGYEGAYLLALAALTRLLTIAAGSAGGIVSFASVWLVAVALETSLSPPPPRHLPPQAYSAGAWQAPPLGADTPVKNSG